MPRRRVYGGIFGNWGNRDEERPTPPRKPLIPIAPRSPQPMDPQAPSLASLGNEIITMITDLLQDTSPQTVSSLALVCSNYYRIARYSQYREVSIYNTGTDYETRADVKWFGRWYYIKNNGIPEAIRRLEVHGNGNKTFVSDLCRFIPKMTGLTDLAWIETGVPEQVIRALKKRPLIRLHTLVNSGHYSKLTVSSILDPLTENANLVSLDVCVTYTSGPNCLAWTQPLKRVLLTCPNLRKLKLDISMPRSGCVMYGFPREYCGFGFVDGERMPALEELELVDYPFGFEAKPSIGPYAILADGYPLEGHELDHWAETFDWSRLRRLNTTHVSFASKLMPRLVSLKELSCPYMVDSDVSSASFLEQVPSSLESITVFGKEHIDFDNLPRHGTSLKKLEIHIVEDYQGKWEERAVDIEALTKIRDLCPNIEELALDLPRDGNWPYDMLEIIASFPLLRYLKIYFELGLVIRDTAIVEPPVTFSAAGYLFTYIRKHRVEHATRLQKVEIVSGSPPPLGHGYPSSQAFWPEYNSTSFIRTASDRDDSKDAFTVRCPDITKQQNEFLWEEMFGVEHLDGNPHADDENFKLARDGPVPMHEWEAHY